MSFKQGYYINFSGSLKLFQFFPKLVDKYKRVYAGYQIFDSNIFIECKDDLNLVVLSTIPGP